LNVLKTNIVTDTLSIITEEVIELEQFMLCCVRVEWDGNMLETLDPCYPILKAISYSSGWESMEDEIMEPGSSSTRKKRGRRVGDGTITMERLETQIILLSNEDISSQTPLTQQFKRNKLE
jgi:hypothetical protein